MKAIIELGQKELQDIGKHFFYLNSIHKLVYFFKYIMIQVCLKFTLYI